MNSTNNKQIVDEFSTALFTNGDLTAVDHYLDPQFINHDPPLPNSPDGPEGMRQAAELFRRAFPDWRSDAEHMIAEDDLVVEHFVAHGTHRGSVMGETPTGQDVALRGIHIFRIANGKIVERWGRLDNLGLLQQLGLVPAPATTSAQALRLRSTKTSSLGLVTTRSIAVVGGGFGGVSAAVMLHRAGYDNVTVFERAARIGGVWHHNTYPGAACDVPSHLYEFSFAPNPSWSRRYARQAEIQAYVEEVARRYGVLDRIHTNTEVASASWDSSRSRWLITSNHGDHEAHILITACGQLSVPKIPQFKGLDTFRGPGIPYRPMAPRCRSFRQARRRDRDRMQCDPSGACDPAVRRERDDLSALPGLDHPQTQLRLSRIRPTHLCPLPNDPAVGPRRYWASWSSAPWP